jgi:hypothetical protein
MGRVALLSVLVAAIVAVVMPGSGVAAKPVFHSHENFSDTFADNVCGIDGTSVVRGVDNFTVYADNTFKDNFTITQTFTATASGKSIRIHAANQVSGNDEPIDNGDGTVTFAIPSRVCRSSSRSRTAPSCRVMRASSPSRKTSMRQQATSSPRRCLARRVHTPISTAISRSSATS